MSNCSGALCGLVEKGKGVRFIFYPFIPVSDAPGPEILCATQSFFQLLQQTFGYRLADFEPGVRE
jgi:hypothetical protein